MIYVKTQNSLSYDDKNEICCCCCCCCCCFKASKISNLLHINIGKNFSYEFILIKDNENRDIIRFDEYQNNHLKCSSSLDS